METKSTAVEEYKERQLSTNERKALVKANVAKFGIEMKDVNTRNFEISTVGKHTIVEIERKGKHYVGLSSCSPNDNHNWYNGVARAFNRAFKCMVESEQLSEKYKKEASYKKLVEMLYGNTDISDKHKVLVVRTPNMHDDFLDAVKYLPPAMRTHR